MRAFELFGEIFLRDNDASKKLKEVEGKAEKAEGALSKSIGTVAKWGGAMVLAAGTAAVAVTGFAVNISEDLNKALNGLQAETGTTEKAMAGMKDSMLDIYNNNFGESFEDIGKSMATVAQATGLTGEELEKATQNALMLRDTFEMDVDGSIVAVNQMMKQFGLTSEESYNLLAQGAQNGMNSQGDLVDIIKEYSGQFKTMGFSAEEMFNMLSNGAKKGGFSIDVMGDAMKEFNIRSKDGSKASAEAFASLGLNSNKLTKAFAKGGAEGKKAFSDVMEKLKGMKDPMAQNQAGVALFGTMWEDLGAEAILALGNTEGGIESAKDALERINAGKYNTFGEAMQGIKRNIETGILIPIGDKLLPTLKKFSGYIVDNMPKIKVFIDEAMSVAGNVFMNIVNVVKDYLIPAFKKFWEWIEPYMPLIKDAVEIAFDIIKGAFKLVGDYITNIVIPIYKAMAEWFFKNFPAIKDAVMKAYDYIKPSFDHLVEVIRDSVMPIINGLWDTVKKAMPGIKAIFELVFPLIVVAVKLAIDIVAEVIKVIKGIYDFIKPGLDDVAELFSSIFGGIKKVIEGVQKVLDFFNGTPAKDKKSTVTTSYVSDYSSTGRRGIDPGRGFATGTNNATAGLHWVGEEGPELLNFKGGETIKNAKDSAKIASGKNSGFNLNIETFVNERKQDVEELAEELSYYIKKKELGGV